MSDDNVMRNSLISCIVCDKEMDNWAYTMHGGKKVEVHPMSGLHFRSTGHYGSSIFDPMGTGEHLDVAICDLCVMTKISKVRGTGVRELLKEHEFYKDHVEKDESRKKASLEQAYNEGFEAFPSKECPYDENTLRHKYWWDGYAQCDLTSAHYS